MIVTLKVTVSPLSLLTSEVLVVSARAVTPMCHIPGCFQAEWSTLIGRGMSRLGSHWSRVLLHKLSYAKKTQLKAPKAAY